MEDLDIEALKTAGFSYEEIQDIILNEKQYLDDGISYSLDDAFSIIKKDIFSNKKFVNV